MANFELPDSPKFNTTMRMLEKKDPANADLFNALFAQLLQNEAYLGLNKFSSDNPPTASQVGLGNVPNVSTNNQTPTYTAAASLSNLTSGEKLSVAFGKIAKGISDLISHLANKSNPHAVTASQIGAVPTTLKINGKPLSGDITLSASDIGAASADVGEETTGTFAYSSDETYFTSGSSSVSIKKCGKVVTISGYIFSVNNGSTNEVEFTAGTVPSGFRPPNSIYGLAWYGGSSDSLKDSRGNSPFIINSSGVMTMTAVQTTYSGRRMHFTVTYNSII